MTLRDIKRRIRSITNTQQVTRAMEMVAAAKMRRACESALMTRQYSQTALEILLDLSVKTDPNLHPLLRKNEGQRLCLILITSDRGLCGGFNANLLKVALKFIEEEKKQGAELEIICIGKKGRDFIQRLNLPLIAEFTNLSDKIKLTEATAIAQIPLDDYLSQKYSRVVLIYTDFVSALTQKPVIKQLLPISYSEMIKLAEIGPNQPFIPQIKKPYEYLFEPSTDEVLASILPRLVEMQIYQAILESKASEHSSRMVAMRNATDAAKEIIDELQLTFNQVRQAVITKELAEISATKLAQEK